MPTAAAATLDDPAEIAALAVDFLHSLDNLPQEVAHRVREIQHKDAKLHGAWDVGPCACPLSLSLSLEAASV